VAPVRWGEASSGRAAAHASFPLISLIGVGTSRRVLLGESDSAAALESGPARRDRNVANAIARRNVAEG
jgi:hypothetical protein